MNSWRLMGPFTQIVTASKRLLSMPVYRRLLIPVAIVVSAVFVTVPTLTTPDNTFARQLSQYGPLSFSTLGVLALLVALFLLMNVYAFRRARAGRDRVEVVAKTSAGSALGTVAAFFGAVSCPMCLGSALGFFGFGTAGFLARNHWWVFSVAIVLMVVSLYFSSRRVNGACRACETRVG